MPSTPEPVPPPLPPPDTPEEHILLIRAWIMSYAEKFVLQQQAGGAPATAARLRTVSLFRSKQHAEVYAPVTNTQGAFRLWTRHLAPATHYLGGSVEAQTDPIFRIQAFNMMFPEHRIEEP